MTVDKGGLSTLSPSERAELDDLVTPDLKVLYALDRSEPMALGMTTTEISDALETAGVHLTSLQVSNLLRGVGPAVSRRKTRDGIRYRVMTAGRKRLAGAVAPYPLVIGVREGSTYQARTTVGTILSEQTGLVRISDPYFGVRTLDLLARSKPAATIRFLTSRASGDKQDRLERSAADLSKEFAHISVRIADPAKIGHDRVIVTSDELIIVGHGLKDVGTRESFIIRLNDSIAHDLRLQVANGFDARWSNAREP